MCVLLHVLNPECQKTHSPSKVRTLLESLIPKIEVQEYVLVCLRVCVHECVRELVCVCVNEHMAHHRYAFLLCV